ncbi:hypothetical protein Tco_0063183 [Tanacetum coccineum]
MAAAITITPRTSPPPAHPTKHHHNITTILAVTAVQTAQWVLAVIRLRTVYVSLNFIESNKEARSLYDGASVFN